MKQITSGIVVCFRQSVDIFVVFICSASPQKHSIVDGMRMIALKLEFGAFHNQIFERYPQVFVLSLRYLDMPSKEIPL